MHIGCEAGFSCQRARGRATISNDLITERVGVFPTIAIHKIDPSACPAIKSNKKDQEIKPPLAGECNK